MFKVSGAALMLGLIVSSPAFADHSDKIWSKSDSPGCCGPGYEGEDPDHFAEQGGKMLSSGPEGWGPGKSWQGQGGSLGRFSWGDSFGGPVNGKIGQGV